MLRTMLKSKIHRAIVTEANLYDEGSITIDAKLTRGGTKRNKRYLPSKANAERVRAFLIRIGIHPPIFEQTVNPADHVENAWDVDEIVPARRGRPRREGT